MNVLLVKSECIESIYKITGAICVSEELFPFEKEKRKESLADSRIECFRGHLARLSKLTVKSSGPGVQPATGFIL